MTGRKAGMQAEKSADRQARMSEAGRYVGKKAGRTNSNRENKFHQKSEV